MLMHTHISPSIFITGMVFIVPLIIGWCIWAYTHGVQISNRIFVKVALLFVIVLVPLFIIFAIIPASQKSIFDDILMILVLLFYWPYCILRIVKRSKKGQVLLKEVGITMERAAALILGVILFAFFGVWLFRYSGFAGSDAIKLTPSIGNVCANLFFLTLAVQSIIWGMTGWQITENGILSSQQGLTKWSNIKSYGWGGAYEATLVLNLHKGIWKDVYLKISQNQKDSIEAILSEKMSPAAKFASSLV
jgi:hypothetical protein